MGKEFRTLLLFFLSIWTAIVSLDSCTKEFSCEGCRELNKPPVASAGPNQFVTPATDSASLDGSGSGDPDGTITTWLWTKISGPSSSIINSPSSSATIVKNLVTGNYQFELKVTDNGGLSATDTVMVTVDAIPSSDHAPVANAGADLVITLPANTITLDGSGSSDTDNNITGYQWSKISGPVSFNISNTSGIQSQVTNLVEGAYLFELKVTDATGLTDKDTVQVNVNQGINNSTLDIYVAGMENNLPVYWKNGQMIPLDNISYGFTGTSIAVVGNDIFVAGTRNELMWNDYAAKYWKNGQAMSLGDAAGATSITVAGSDVYVAGWKWEPSGSGAVAVAKYWKNGQAVSLTDGTREAYANCIIVSGGDVYVAGQETVNSTAYSNYIAKYWKNGVPVLLTSASSDAWANSITVVDNDVYVAGYENGIAKYWKNGQSVPLSQGNATSIAVVGSDVYVAGYYHQGQGNSIAKYWKNGQEVSLTSGSEAFATSVALFGSDVYVAGFEINFPSFTYTAKYWKNGQATQLSNGMLAGSIVVMN